MSVYAWIFLLKQNTRRAGAGRQTIFVLLILLLVSGVVNAVDRCKRTASRRSEARSLSAPELVRTFFEPSPLPLHLQPVLEEPSHTQLQSPISHTPSSCDSNETNRDTPASSGTNPWRPTIESPSSPARSAP